MKARNTWGIVAVIAALGPWVSSAVAQPATFSGQYPPVLTTDALHVGSGDGQVVVDRDFTGRWAGPDQLPYTDDDQVISTPGAYVALVACLAQAEADLDANAPGCTPGNCDPVGSPCTQVACDQYAADVAACMATAGAAGEFIEGDIWDGPGGFTDDVRIYGNQGYGSLGLPYPPALTDLCLIGPDGAPPPGGALGAGTLTAFGTPAMPDGFDLNTPFGAQPPYVYNMYTSYNGVVDTYWLFAMNGRLWDGRIAEWELEVGALLTGVDLGIQNFDLDALVTSDLWDDGGAFAMGMYFMDDDEPVDQEQENNCGLYNNARADQHGQGNPRYYYHIGNDDPLNDEHRRHQYDLVGMSSTEDLPNSDDKYSRTDQVDVQNPALTAQEKQAIRDGTWIAGFLIPIADLPSLQDGALGDAAWHAAHFPNHPYPNGMDLNGDGDIDDAGEQPFDMATYVREILYKQLLDGADDPGHTTPGLQPHPNLSAANGPVAAGIGLCIRHAMDELRYLHIGRVQAPTVITGNALAQKTATLYGAETYRDGAEGMTTYTDIMVTDGDLETRQGFQLSATPKYGVQFNTVAIEGFVPVAFTAGADWNGDGELKHGLANGINAWTLFNFGVGQAEDGAVAQLTNVISDSESYLGLGGRKKDAGGSRCNPGIPADPKRVWCLEDGPAFAEAVVRMEPSPFTEFEVLHLILERDNVPVAWAIIMDGRKPILGVGGATITDDACGNVYGGVDVTTSTCCQANVGGDAVLKTDADPSQPGDQYANYLLSLNDCTKEVKLYLDAGDGTNNLLATYNYAGSGCTLPPCVDGMRIFVSGLIADPVPNPLLCTDVEPSDTTRDFVEVIDVDLLSWGYDAFETTTLALEAVAKDLIGDPITPANGEDYVWPVSEQDGNAAGGLTSIDIQVTSGVPLVQTDSCVTTQSGGGPTTATIAPLGPAGAYRVTLDGPIPLGEWTTVTLTVKEADNPCSKGARLCFHLGWQPGDTNGDGQTNLNDATSFGQQFARGINAALMRADLNVDGQVNLNDATRFGNIWNGSSGEQTWLGTGLGPKPGCDCP